MVLRWPGLIVMRFVAMRSALRLAGIIPGRNGVLRPDLPVTALNTEIAPTEIANDLAAAVNGLLLRWRVSAGTLAATTFDVPTAVWVLSDDAVVLLHRLPLRDTGEELSQHVNSHRVLAQLETLYVTSPVQPQIVGIEV